MDKDTLGPTRTTKLVQAQNQNNATDVRAATNVFMTHPSILLLPDKISEGAYNHKADVRNPATSTRTMSHMDARIAAAHSTCG